MGKNLLKLSDLHTDEIIAILDRAQMFCQGIDVPKFSDKIACNLFFESSTRTQYSFNVAEERLGMRVVSFNPASSSLNKNES
ncbi:MAG: aspartate carbamoyltransferase, partial [Clostridia bacterium]|nr:aspartate carbamoyltransferase [Clostridia bacterium]